jgi:hypothetical protein
MSVLISMLKQHKEMYDAIAKRCNMHPQHHIHGFVLEHGRPFTAAPRPDWCERGTPKECFSNAFHLALETGLIYVEGFMLRDGLPIPIHHGWCVDGDVVIDPTINDPENCEYYGIPMDTDFVLLHTTTSGVYGILDNPNSKRIYETVPDTFLETI